LVLTFFIYILFCNWIGLLPGFGSIGFNEVQNGTKVFVPLLRGATADLNTTLALALIAFFSIQYYGFAGQKLGYLKKFFNFSSPVMFFSGILELISELAKIISFSFRLFGNVFAGEVLLSVMTFLIPVIIPLPFVGLEIFVGLIQALVFSLLTLVFINIAMSAHGEEVEHGIN
jgi:F-type H+-transporting ATPase subunit a